jgi:predicted transglutaminase-like cysteine proteinase
MVRLALSAIFLLGSGAFFLMAHAPLRPQAAQGFFRLSPPRSPEARVLEALNAANAVRVRAGLPKLKMHPELQVALDDYVREGVGGGLEGAFRFAGERLPSVRSLSGNFMNGASEERLLRELENWAEVLDPEHTHLAVQFFEEKGQEAPGCIVVLANVFPEFRPPMRSQGITGFFNRCRWCGAGHGVSVTGGGQTTLVVNCPKCGRTSDLVATDSDGCWRRASEFLRPEIRDCAVQGMPDVMAIWTALVSNNRYQKDAERIGGTDSWTMPDETLRRGVGDCEDTSLALAQLLLERGYEVRVVLGKHKGQGHAWCVLRWEGATYLLETTSSQIFADRPPLVSEMKFDYVPDYQFDAERMYFKNFDGWTSEYWSEKNWAATRGRSSLVAGVTSGFQPGANRGSVPASAVSHGHDASMPGPHLAKSPGTVHGSVDR